MVNILQRYYFTFSQVLPCHVFHISKDFSPIEFDYLWIHWHLQALDYLAIGVHELASISERRIERLCNPSLSELPAFLVTEGGLNSGFMIAHCTAAALGKSFIYSTVCVFFVKASQNSSWGTLTLFFFPKWMKCNNVFLFSICPPVSENKVLCHPSSVDSLSTSAATEDHVSMGGWAARKSLRVIENVEHGKI